jgi:predicted YcjX-like family ATPase
MIRLTRLIALAAAVCVAGSALAQVQTRRIPDTAKRGQMTYLTQSVVEVDGTRMQLAAGARIWNRENLTIVPAALPRDSLVEYEANEKTRQIYRVWILTDAEAARPNKNTDTSAIGTPLDRLWKPPFPEEQKLPTYEELRKQRATGQTPNGTQ